MYRRTFLIGFFSCITTAGGSTVLSTVDGSIVRLLAWPIPRRTATAEIFVHLARATQPRL